MGKSQTQSDNPSINRSDQSSGFHPSRRRIRIQQHKARHFSTHLAEIWHSIQAGMLNGLCLLAERGQEPFNGPRSNADRMAKFLEGLRQHTSFYSYSVDNDGFEEDVAICHRGKAAELGAAIAVELAAVAGGKRLSSLYYSDPAGADQVKAKGYGLWPYHA